MNDFQSDNPYMLKAYRMNWHIDQQRMPYMSWQMGCCCTSRDHIECMMSPTMPMRMCLVYTMRTTRRRWNYQLYQQGTQHTM